MTEFEIIQEEIEAIKQKYLRSAMDIISDYNIPPKTNSSMDGYAVKTDDIIAASINNPV